MKGKLICTAAVGLLVAATISGCAVGEQSQNMSDTEVDSSKVTSNTDNISEGTADSEADSSDITTNADNISEGITDSEADGIDITSEEPVNTLYTSGTVEAVDFVDDRVTYTFDIQPDSMRYDVKIGYEYKYELSPNDVTLNYLKDFFGNDNLLVDEAYKGNFTRFYNCAIFYCKAPLGSPIYSPVDGKVISVCNMSDPLLGNSVAVEFGDKIFIVHHLDETSVKAGDTVSANQVLGLCGWSGLTSEPKLGLIIVNKK